MLFKSDLCFILRVKSLTFCYKNTKRCLCTCYFRPTLILGIQTINERKDEILNKKDKKSAKEGQRGEGGGTFFKQVLGRGV